MGIDDRVRTRLNQTFIVIQPGAVERQGIAGGNRPADIHQRFAAGQPDTALFSADKASTVVQPVGGHAEAVCRRQFALAVVRQVSRFYGQGAGIGGDNLALAVIQRRGVNVDRGVGGNHALAIINAVLMVQRQRPCPALAYLTFLVLQAFCRERELVGGEQATVIVECA